MSTGTVLIKKALQRIGADSIVTPAAPENIEEGLFYLNTLLELWLSKGIDIGTVPIAAAGDEVNEPVDARSAIINNLAIGLAPSFDNGKVIVSQNLKDAARSEFASIKILYQDLQIPEKKFSSTLPLGAGNQFRSFGTGVSPGSGVSGGTGGILPIPSGGTNSSTASGARTNLGLEIDTDVQAFDPILADLSGLTQAINTIPYFDTAISAALLNFLDEDSMVSDDPLGLASQQSIKAYIDAQVTAADLDFSGDSGTGAVDLDTQVFSVVGGGGITTLAASQALTISLDASNAIQTALPNLVTVGVLNSGSIASGFGSIDIGVSPFTTTGLISGGTAAITGTITGPSGAWETGGLNLAASDSVSFNSIAILSDAAGVTSLLNIDAIDAITEATIEVAIDTLPNLTAATALVSVGALNAGSITSGFGSIDIGSSAFTTTGAGAFGSATINSIAVADIDDVETTARNADTSTALTLALTDRGQTVTMDNAAANVVTIPTNASVAFPFSTSNSTVVNVIQIGAGITSITADTGVTLNGVSAGSGALLAQFGGVTLLKVATNTWIAAGAIGTVA